MSFVWSCSILLVGKDFGISVVIARLSQYSIRIDCIYSVPGIHCHMIYVIERRFIVFRALDTLCACVKS